MKRGKKKRRVVQTFFLFLFSRRQRLDFIVLSVIQLRDRRLSSVCVRHYKPAKCWQFSLSRLAEKRWRRTQIPAVIQFRSTLYILCNNNNNNDPRQLGDGETKKFDWPFLAFAHTHSHGQPAAALLNFPVNSEPDGPAHNKTCPVKKCVSLLAAHTHTHTHRA
jgi:hypothetical protein